MHTEVNYIEIVISKYHDDIVARIRYEIEKEIFESALYSISEVNNILALWRDGSLCGSFGLGHKVAKE